MGTQSPTHRDRVVGGLADRQHGVVNREQLLAAGQTPRVIRRAVEAGRWRLVFRGVYAVGHLALRREGWWMAALLACDEGAVTTSTDHGRKHRQITTHRMLLAPLDALLRDNLRLTTPSRTIVDLAATLQGRALRETVERAQDLRRMFLALARKARLPQPASNLEIAGRSRDFAWPDRRLVVETDGYRYHSARQAKRRDNRRDRQLTALGWRPVRFTYEEIAFEPAEVAKELVGLLSRDHHGGQPALSRNARTEAT